MTNEKMELVNKLKEKIAEINNIVSEFNKDADNPLIVKIYQQDWDSQMNSRAVKNAVKFVACTVSETFVY
jgi:hypothetical protein